MTYAPVGAEDETIRRRLLADAVLPGWIARCGEECRDAWNTYLAPLTRIVLPEKSSPSPVPALSTQGGPRLVVAP
jgi:hypothetical protein